jgi:hypothetical protein
MRTTNWTRRATAAAAVALGMLLGLASGGCAAPGPSPDATKDQPTPGASAAPTVGVELTPVPGGGSPSPPDEIRPPTTVTDWGTILDRVPDGFPVYPGAAGIDPIDGPVSGAWEAVADPGEVVGWYVSAFEELGWSRIDVGSPLEDGSQVLDLASDLPECRVQLAVRPLGGSTMISVLYGAGCAGGDG